MNNCQKLIQTICEEENIKFQRLSKNWISMLEKDGKTKFISGYKFDLNSHGLGELLDDKYATYEMLSKKQIPIIPHHILFSPQNKETYALDCNKIEVAEKLYFKYQKNIVIKPNIGTCGRDVYHITKQEEIDSCLKKLWQSNFSVSVCPFYKIKAEYRMIVLKNECQAMYQKQRPIVVGDGRKTIRELLIEFNPLLKEKLKNQTYDKILETGEEYIYSWKYNLSLGAIPVPITNEIQSKLNKLLLQVTEEINLGFCSVDVIETEDHEFFILEINSGVMMDHFISLMQNGKQIAKEIYRNAIKAMFQE